MWWLGGSVLLLFCIGRSATAELFSFDLSSLRSEEPCEASEILRGGSGRSLAIGNDGRANFCPIENHLKVIVGDKTTLLQSITQIRRVSPTRAIALTIEDDTSLISKPNLAPIAQQIVQLIISILTSTATVPDFQADLTSRFPTIPLDNLLDLRFWRVDGLRIHKADFAGMKNIRAIEFRGSPPVSIEQGTFTDIPTLQTLALGNDIASSNTEKLAIWKQLKCDAKNAWLWEFLKGKPGLRKSRGVGDIFTLGNFTSTFLDVDEPDVICGGLPVSFSINL